MIFNLGGYEFDDDASRVDPGTVWEFLSQAYWNRGRTKPQFEAQLASAWRVVGVYEAGPGRQVGFARAVSDGEFFAYLADVFILPGARGAGLGRELVATMIERGPGTGFRWTLHTADAHELYRKFGFAEPDTMYMERPRRPGPGRPNRTEDHAVPVLEGVIVALITPVDRAGDVDHGALGRLVERLAGRGVTGVSPLGSTGEGYSLGLEQRLAVVETVARSVPAGMPVIPGVFAHNHEQAVAEIAAYAERGGTAVLAAPPSYYPLRPAEQEAYFARLADAAALPLVLYNIPVFTKVQIAPAAAAAFAAHPRVAGLKDSGRDLGYAAGLLDAVAAAGAAADFSVLTGTDSMLVSYLLHGARGTICANANVVPELVRSVYDAVGAGKLDEALRLESRLRAVQAAFGTATVPAGYKAAVAAAGVGERWLVPPRQPLTDAETARLLDRLAALDVR